jgi:hypothetical protein
VGPLETAAAAVAAGLTVARSTLATARGRAGEAVAAFRAGPVLPWISAHRLPVLLGGALLASALAIGGTVAMIAQVPGPVAGGEAPDDAARPQPGSGFTMPRPAAGTSKPTPSPSPPPSPKPTDDPLTGDAGAPAVDAEPSPAPVDTPTADSPGNGRQDPPGATNNPKKPKDDDQG